MEQKSIEINPWKLLLIDDDPFFCTLMETTAQYMGLNLATYESVAEIGFFARIKEYDAAILDFRLEHLNGVEIAEYIDTFFSDLPVILVTAQDIAKIRSMRWPECIREVIPKTKSPRDILNEVVYHLKRRNFLRGFEAIGARHQDFGAAKTE